MQDTLVRAYRSIDGFDGQYPRAWLLTILRNAERNRHRRTRPGLLHDDPGPTFDRLEDPQGASHDPAYIVVESDFNAEVERAFHELPARYRTVVALVDIEGFSYIEAAQVLDVPKGTVMSRLHRARKRIRDRLGGTGLNHVQRGER